MPARWRITSDEGREELSKSGTFETVRVIGFEVLETGSTGEVKVPLRLYTPDYVQSEIQRYADTIVQVSGLGT